MKESADLPGLLGLAARAGAVAAGEEACLRAVRSRRALLVIVANDTGPNGAKKLFDKCAFYGVPVYSALTKNELGRAIGKEVRTAVGVMSRQFAEQIKRELAQFDGGDRI